MRTNRRGGVVRSATVLVTLAIGGCYGRPPLPNVGPSPSPNVPDDTVVKIVPAETPFTVELATELSSTTDRTGDPFRANVVTPLLADDGDTVVSPAAEIAGQIVAIREAPEPSILVRFDSIETHWGPRLIHATFARAQPQASILGERARFAGYDGAIRPAPGIPLLTSDAPAAPAAIDLPAGARLRLLITDAFVVRALEPPSNLPAR